MTESVIGDKLLGLLAIAAVALGTLLLRVAHRLVRLVLNGWTKLPASDRTAAAPTLPH